MDSHTPTRQLIAGLAAIAAILFLVWRAHAPPPADAEVRLSAVFNDTAGLLQGADVRLAGIRVGVVEKQRLHRGRAEVFMRLDIPTPLPVDSSASIQTDGLFGSKFITLEPGGSLETIRDGDTLTYTENAIALSDLLDQIIARGEQLRRRDGKTRP